MEKQHSRACAGFLKAFDKVSYEQGVSILLFYMHLHSALCQELRVVLVNLHYVVFFHICIVDM